MSFGIGRTLDDEPESIMLKLKEPLRIDPETTTDVIGFRIYNFDPTLAPEGKTTVTSMIGTFNHRYWLDLRKNDREKY
ncbi:MAG: hypothetical protein ACLFPE_07555, partial [Bacteroidales bacterium]